MKNFVFFLFIIAFSLSSISQEYIEFTSTETKHPTYNVLISEDTIVEFELRTPGMYVSEADSFQRIEIEGYFKMNSAGFPEIPQVRLRLCLSHYCPFRLQPEKPAPKASIW
jgi:hypothetical protein